MTCDCCDCINIGDTVEHKMNTRVFGIVIGEAGSLRYIRVSPSLAVMGFHEWELRLVDDEEYEPPVSDEVGNVVRVDFTKGGALRKNTKTEGSA